MLTLPFFLFSPYLFTIILGQVKSKIEIHAQRVNLEKQKKRKFKKRYWLLIDLAIVVVISALLLHKPAHYNADNTSGAGENNRQVSTYLTHQLSPQFYNGVQRGEPFELVITESGINDIIRRSGWPKESGGVWFRAPEVLFAVDEIVLRATANIKGVEFVVTFIINPSLDRSGRLNLQITKVKVGAMNITFLAKTVARRMYQQQLAGSEAGKEDIRAKIAASLLNDEPFEPVFSIEDKKVRAEKITLEKDRLTIHLVPLSE